VVDYKNAYDMFRRKLQKRFGREEGKHLIKHMIPTSKGCYMLDASVKVKGSGQVGIKPTKSKQNRPGVN
jgi:hypothetical protein